ncbi:hypothetical protein T439DRAFT_321842 [Meredithblackwellia eburnea MCA 4105]
MHPSLPPNTCTPLGSSRPTSRSVGLNYCARVGMASTAAQALPLATYQELVATLPSLVPFINSLAATLASPAPPQSVFIHAPTNASLVVPLVKLILHGHLASISPLQDIYESNSKPTIQDLLPRIAVVDLEEVSSTRSIFDRVLNELSGWSGERQPPAWNEGEANVVNWDGRTKGFEVKKGSMKRAAGGQGTTSKVRKRARTSTSTPPERAGSDGESEDDDVEREMWALKWSRTTQPPKDPVGPLHDSLDYFHLGLSKILNLGVQVESQTDKEDDLLAIQRRQRWLLIDHGELLNDVANAGNAGGAPKETGLGMTFASTIHRLGELSNVPITTVTVSSLGWIKARESMVGLASPVLVTFPLLAPNDCLNLLAQRFARQAPNSQVHDRGTLTKLFRSLATVVYDTFGSTAKNNVEELAYLTAKFWPRWLSCTEQGNPPIPPSDTARIAQQLKPYFTRELEQIAEPHQSLSQASAFEPILAPQGFSGHMPASPTTPTASSSRALDTSYPLPGSSSTTPLRRQAVNITPSGSLKNPSSPEPFSNLKQAANMMDQSLAKNLPVLAKWLLVAAFYAGHNPAKSDVIKFVKVDEGIAKKGKKNRKSPAKKPGSPSKARVKADLTGGKSFPLERLLAIFEALIDENHEYAGQSVDILMQVTTLVDLRLLQRISAQDKLMDGVKLKCRLPRDTVDALARSIGFKNWTEYLWDAEA